MRNRRMVAVAVVAVATAGVVATPEAVEPLMDTGIEVTVICVQDTNVC